jgi:hypothetical protein
MAKHYTPQRDYFPRNPVEAELRETCDVYGTFGDPSGTEHHACLDELFGGTGYQIKELYKPKSKNIR